MKITTLGKLRNRFTFQRVEKRSTRRRGGVTLPVVHAYDRLLFALMSKKSAEGFTYKFHFAVRQILRIDDADVVFFEYYVLNLQNHRTIVMSTPVIIAVYLT